MTALERVVIVGVAGTGKTVLGQSLASMLDAPFFELDSLYWKPEWVEPSQAEFAASIEDAIVGDRWVAAGNYLREGVHNLWSRADVIIWLDLPLRVTFPRVLRRSLQRWLSNERLWSDTRESLWQQLRVWDIKTSLWAYSARMHAVRRNRYLAAMLDERRPARFVRLTSPGEVEAFIERLRARTPEE